MALKTRPRGSKSDNSKKPDPVQKAVSTSTSSPAPSVKLQRSPKLIALALVLIVLGATGAAWLATTFRDTTDVVSVKHSVSRGEVIKREDLQTASITLDPALRTIPKAQLESLVGKIAASDLTTGAIVTPDQVTATAIPAKGSSVVGLQLSQGQMPQSQLRTSAPVRLVTTPRSGDDPAAPSEQVSYKATVVGVREAGDGSHMIVDVLVPADQAGAVAALGATQRLALILDGE